MVPPEYLGGDANFDSYDLSEAESEEKKRKESEN